MPVFDVARARKLGIEEAEVTYRDSTIKVKFSADAYTPAFEREIVGALEAEAKSGYFAQFLARVVTAWDVVEDGKPYPLTVERLEELPVRFLHAIHDALLERILPNVKSPEPTGSFS